MMVNPYNGCTHKHLSNTNTKHNDYNEASIDLLVHGKEFAMA